MVLLFGEDNTCSVSDLKLGMTSDDIELASLWVIRYMIWQGGC